jgi:hypothetical protein
MCESPIEESNLCSDALAVLTSEVGDDEETTEDDQREWEECMDRRRMMFAMRQSQSEDGLGSSASGNVGMGCPEFEGYRSISATLVEMLRSVGHSPGNSTPPIQEEEEEEEEATEEGVSGEGIEGIFERLRLRGSGRDGMETPSLISSAGSELDCTLASPGVVIVEFASAEMEKGRGEEAEIEAVHHAL